MAASEQFMKLIKDCDPADVASVADMAPKGKPFVADVVWKAQRTLAAPERTQIVKLVKDL